MVDAVVGFEVESLTTRLILAPLSALMPPAALISSATSSMPLRELTPNWAFAPESGTTTPILIAAGCAELERITNGAVMSTAATSAIACRRLRTPFFETLARHDISFSPASFYQFVCGHDQSVG